MTGRDSAATPGERVQKQQKAGCVLYFGSGKRHARRHHNTTNATTTAQRVGRRGGGGGRRGVAEAAGRCLRMERWRTRAAPACREREARMGEAPFGIPFGVRRRTGASLAVSLSSRPPRACLAVRGKQRPVQARFVPSVPSSLARGRRSGFPRCVGGPDLWGNSRGKGGGGVSARKRDRRGVVSASVRSVGAGAPLGRRQCRGVKEESVRSGRRARAGGRTRSRGSRAPSRERR